MATKEEVLQAVRELANLKVISQEELLGAYQQGVGVPSIDAPVVTGLTKKLTIADILYYIGGGIVFIGIAILIFQNWEILGVPARIMSTLGVGVAAYLAGLLFGRNEKMTGVSVAFFLISALVLPIGIAVTYFSAGIDVDTIGFQVQISAILLVVYLLSRFVFRHTVFTLFSIIYGTWLYYVLTEYMLQGSGPVFEDWKFFAYRTLLAGIVYILIGYWLDQRKDEESHLSGFLYSFGVLGFLGSALALGGYNPEQNVFWEIIFPGLVFAVLFLSVHLKSRSFLVFGTLFLMGYILKITAEYFTEGMGWPLSLVIAGLALIAVGYMSFRLNEKYIKANAN